MAIRPRLFFSALTGSLLFIPAVALYSELARRPDIWWTPAPMALSPAESRDRVEIYVRGKPLAAVLAATQLSVTDEGRSIALSPEDVRLRFNNWDRVRVGRLPLLLLYAAALGAGVLLVLLNATGRLVYRGETPRP
ncbi:MAG TPA: hypothetical protein VGQ48_10145 [Gemmatimonadales bacterium]|jgi:hypothetical protein|nr:hypothetical protein [Gemmatimonadales bacterium]